ncbi:MAG: NAD(P)H-dependent oxidoreductase subunit E [Treponema sp.]|nr:MAG: NAD(P)H-dependent oxidoreductase subunit E [Treponema sp.]
MNNAGFSPELMDFIEEWKDKPGCLIMILHKVQSEQGYISKEAAKAVSDFTKIPFARVYGTMTFYHFFKTVKPGEHTIAVCLGTACYLKGSQDLLDETRKILGMSAEQVTTDDGLFSVEAVRCIGCCGLAPVLSVDGNVYGRLKPKDVSKIIDEYKGA